LGVSKKGKPIFKTIGFRGIIIFPKRDKRDYNLIGYATIYYPFHPIPTFPPPMEGETNQGHAGSGQGP
jgi:hypothetical protein